MVAQSKVQASIRAAVAGLVLTACGGKSLTAPEVVDRRSRSSTSGDDQSLEFNPELCKQKRPVLGLAGPEITVDERILPKLNSILQKMPLQVSPSLGSLTARDQVSIFDYRFLYKGIPICNLQVKFHVFDDAVMVSGDPVVHPMAGKEFPNDPLSILRRPWPGEEDLRKRVAEALLAHPSSVELFDTEPCVALDATEITPLVDFKASIDGRLFYIQASEKHIRSISDGSFHLTGTARIYESNPKEGQLTDFTIPLVEAEGKLRSKWFTSKRTDNIPSVQSVTRSYKFPADSPEFEEVSVFTNAERTASWFTQAEHRYEFDCAPITLTLQEGIRSSGSETLNKENAQYQPPGKSTPPAIIVGAGGERLKNLRIDRDVVAHEFGHHVITQKIRMPKKASGEAEELEIASLHEGLADYFVYAMTGNTCLGESVFVGHPCLRSPEPDEFLIPVADPYLQGTTLAGTLWKLREIPSSASPGAAPLGRQVDILVFRSLEYVLYSSNYKDFLKALLLADKELHQEQFGCRILETFENAGFHEYTAGLDCKSP